jgi:leukotriene-A4 hydrolase
VFFIHALCVSCHLCVLQSGRAAAAQSVLRVAYSTSPEASGVQWLNKEQTAGKQHPYLFTQCQAIHARTLMPCQDSSSNKSTYSADITVPEPLVALMSALSTEKKGNTYWFEQKVVMPSYLLALVVGDVVKEDISERCAVWSEPSMVKAGAYEFAETETFLAAAEDICGPYVWGRYDVLLLPPRLDFCQFAMPSSYIFSFMFILLHLYVCAFTCQQLPLRWNGEPVPHIRHAYSAGRRQVSGQRGSS